MVIGRYHIIAYERATSIGGFRADKAIRIASPADLALLTPLLAPGVDHAARIAAGDVCVWAATPDGAPAGLQWVNVTGHPDPHFGRLSRPVDGVAYLNQIVVDDRYRVRGYAPRVMIASIEAAGAAGFPRVRGLVATSNPTMQTLLEGLGFERVGSQRGVRVGRAITLRMPGS
ncbi:MAG: GNAT family N-acetyltransferase [Acidimicrobiia bacterium]